MGFGVVDEKELPEYTNADANKVLKIDENGVYVQWLQQTSDLPVQTGNSGRFLTTNGSVASWAAISTIPSQTGNANRLLTTDGTNASWTATPSITSLQLSAGSATNPTLTFDDPTVPQNCGFYGGGNDVVHFSAAGSNQLSFVSTGIQMGNGKTIRSLSSANSYFDFQGNLNPRINNSQTVSGTTTVSSANFGTSNLTLLNTTSATGATGSAQIQMGATGTITMGVAANSATPSTVATISSGEMSITGNINVTGGIRAAGGLVGGSNGYHYTNHANDGMFFKNSTPFNLQLRRSQGAMLELTGDSTNAYETIFRTNPAAASASGATERMRIGNTQISASLPINITHAGGPTGPSLMFGDGVTGPSGIYSNPTDNNLNFCTNGQERLRLTGDGTVILSDQSVLKGHNVDSGFFAFDTGLYPTMTTLNLINSGTATGPSLMFGDADSGIYSNPPNALNFSTDGVERMIINASGISVTGNISATGNILGSFSPNPLNLVSAPRQTYRIIDATTGYTVDANCEPVIIITRSTTSSSPARLSIPAASTLPAGLSFRVYIFNLPGRFTTLLNSAQIACSPSSNNPLIFDVSGDIKYFVGNQIYSWSSSTVTYTVLDWYNWKEWDTGKSRWLVTPVSKWVEPSPATTIWAGQDN